VFDVNLNVIGLCVKLPLPFGICRLPRHTCLECETIEVLPSSRLPAWIAAVLLGDALPGADEATQTKSIPRTKLLALIIVGVLYVNIANWEQFLTDKDCD